jgi:hypothetical protein
MATDFRPIIQQAYRDILGRDGDLAGLDSWNAAMQGGMTEASVREAFIRSAEYAAKHPDSPTPTDGIRIVNGRFTPQPTGFADDGAIRSPRDGALAWPLCEPTEVDAYSSAKANLAVFRTGPYSDQGLGWGLLVSPIGESRLRRAVKYANTKGITGLVEAGVDCWALRNSWDQMYNDGPDVVRAGPPVRYQRWVREVVHQVGDLNVLWSLGNEGWLVNPAQEWYDGLVTVIRQAETDFGYVHHPMGNVWGAGSIGHPRYDFVEIHGAPEELATQSDIGIPIILTESNNEDPPESNDRWIAARNAAEASNGRLACVVWRGDHKTDADWDALFASLGGHGPVRGPRADSACLLNLTGNQSSMVPNEPISDAEAQIIADATERVIAKNPWLFVNGGDNLACTGSSDDDHLRQDFFSLLQAEAQPHCTLAGSSTADNAFREIDNIEIFAGPADPCLTAGHSRGLHSITFGHPGNFCKVARGVDGVKNSFRGSSAWTFAPRCTQ